MQSLVTKVKTNLIEIPESATAPRVPSNIDPVDRAEYHPDISLENLDRR